MGQFVIRIYLVMLSKPKAPLTGQDISLVQFLGNCHYNGVGSLEMEIGADHVDNEQSAGYKDILVVPVYLRVCTSKEKRFNGSWKNKCIDRLNYSIDDQLFREPLVDEIFYPLGPIKTIVDESKMAAIEITKRGFAEVQLYVSFNPRKLRIAGDNRKLEGIFRKEETEGLVGKIPGHWIYRS